MAEGGVGAEGAEEAELQEGSIRECEVYEKVSFRSYRFFRIVGPLTADKPAAANLRTGAGGCCKAGR